MRGVILREIGKPVEVSDDLTVRRPGPGEVRVRLRAAGVCHSDLSMCEGRLPARLPLVPGHEGAGEVVELGPGVSGPPVGTRVILSWIPPCGGCHLCLGGQPNLCVSVPPPAPTVTFEGEPAHAALGVGCFAEETVVDARAAVPIPDDVPFDVAAVVGCAVLTGVGAVVNTARVRPGSSVLVIGCGGVGINVIQGARLAAAAPILAVDPFPEKLEAARAFGATHVTTPDGLGEAIKELTAGGGGFDYAFEVVGRSATIRQAWRATRRGGTTVVVGAGSAEDLVSFSAAELFYTERRLVGCLYGSGDVRTDFGRLLRLWRAGRLDLDGLITRRIGLGDVGAAFAEMGSGAVIRSLVTF
ncbi:Zn-dependent alcohol dehydrogenase [Nonomuraea candida]|uniref:Zn-dependent alcohol dehydrogenase n=1 Tax=Nonomuraea candida TaxID=359159 RepID=UPI0005BA958A|nr:Zn-dependent alcohol dehydrogenase [Nonomuraea candida]